MTTYKFLIDECLSPELAEMAVQRDTGNRRVCGTVDGVG